MVKKFGELALYNPFIISHRIPTNRKTEATYDAAEDPRDGGGAS